MKQIDISHLDEKIQEVLIGLFIDKFAIIMLTSYVQDNNNKETIPTNIVLSAMRQSYFDLLVVFKHSSKEKEDLSDSNLSEEEINIIIEQIEQRLKILGVDYKIIDAHTQIN